MVHHSHTTYLLRLLAWVSFLSLTCLNTNASVRVRYDGADWHLKGDGVVCCPCTVPCPCRTNGAPIYGHCEATRYLRVKQGHYRNVKLDSIQMISSGGMCAISYRQFSVLYFDRSARPAQQSALMKLIASFSPQRAISFPHVRVVHIDSEVTGNHLFNISIPGVLEMIVDRDWDQRSPPMPWVAALDEFSNMIQYVQNIRYQMHDPEAGLDFDYSYRQANYRVVDLGVDQYRSKSMLIQFRDGEGWFNAQQMALIKTQHLAVPRLDDIRKRALRLRKVRSR